MSEKDMQRRDRVLSRRQWLQAIGVTSGIALSGCSGTGDSEGTPTDSDGPTDSGRSDTPMRLAWGREPPAEHNLNVWAANHRSEITYINHCRTGNYNYMTFDWIGQDEESIDVTENEIRVTIKDGTFWHQDGEVIDDVTGEDWAMHMQMQERLMVPEDARPDNPLVVDWFGEGKELVGELNPDGANADLVIPSFVRQSFTHYRDGWMREHYEGLQDATSESAANEIRGEVVNQNWTLRDYSDRALSGPYMPTSVTGGDVEFERVPDHWTVDDVNWDTFVLKAYPPDGNADYEAAVNDEVDIGFSIPITVPNPPEHIKSVQNPAGSESYEVAAINFGSEGDLDPYMAADEVAEEHHALIRQAMAHSVNVENALLNNYGERIAQNHDPTPKPIPGNPAQVRERFPDLWDAVPSYVEQDLESAEAKLERAGLELDGDTWVTPDGSPLELSVSSYAWSRDSMETVVTGIQEVGIAAEHRVTENSVNSAITSDGTFGMTQQWDRTQWPSSMGARWWIDGAANDIDNNPPPEFEVPPLYEYDASPSETVVISELTDGFSSMPESELDDQVEMMLWTCAYHMPFIPLWPIASSAALNTNHFDWPEPLPDGQFAQASSDDHYIWGVPQMWRELQMGVEGTVAKN